MKKILFICLILATLSGCAYISHTRGVVDADDVEAEIEGIPIGALKKGHVVFDRDMHVCVFHCSQIEKGDK